jgi:hypothetical protein
MPIACARRPHGLNCPAMSLPTQPIGGGAPDATRPAARRPAAPAPADPDPIVGFLVFYSEMSEAPTGQPDPRLGRVYAMRESDVFFVGKAPLPEEVPVEGSLTAAPTAHHLFPASSDYAHISRRHAVIRMGRGGKIRVTDLSTNGLFFVSGRRHARRTSGAGPEVHELAAPETIVFGLDENAFKDPRWQERADRFQVEIVPVGGSGA